MITDLSELEIRQLLENMHYGHLGCCDEPCKPYVVPVTYVYHDRKIYTYSRPGTKIDLMRKKPNVCFQVEELISDTSWQSAQVWGTYRELSGTERDTAFSKLMERFWEAFNKKISIYFPFRNPDAEFNSEDMVIFAIDIESLSGRSESYDS